MWNWFKLFGRWISCFTSMSCVSWIKKKTYIKPYYWKRLNMPKTYNTENKIEIRNVSMFLMKSFTHRNSLIWLSMPLALTFYIYMQLIGCYVIVFIMNAYTFVYCLYTERHFCLLHSEINSWNSPFNIISL